MEIGSEMQLNLKDINEIATDNIFEYLSDYNCIFLDSGRSALRLIDKLLPKGGILIPDYICESVNQCFSDREIHYYRVNRDFTVDIASFMSQSMQFNPRIVFVMNYWGITMDQKEQGYIREYCDQKDMIIVEDTSHSVFSKAVTVGDYCVCSIRKWFPVARGGLLYSKKPLQFDGELIKYGASEDKLIAQGLKQLYIREGNSDYSIIYRKIFSNDIKQLNEQHEIFYMPPFSRFILERLSIGDVIKKRKRNLIMLNRNIIAYSLPVRPAANFPTDIVPFAFPIYVKNRDELRRYLEKKQIYCAIHWPMGWKDTDLGCCAMSSEIISLNIDQRYGSDEMNRIAKEIFNFYYEG